MLLIAATRLYAAVIAIPSGKDSFGFNVKYAEFTAYSNAGAVNFEAAAPVHLGKRFIARVHE